MNWSLNRLFLIAVGLVVSSHAWAGVLTPFKVGFANYAGVRPSAKPDLSNSPNVMEGFQLLSQGEDCPFFENSGKTFYKVRFKNAQKDRTVLINFKGFEGKEVEPGIFEAEVQFLPQASELVMGLVDSRGEIEERRWALEITEWELYEKERGKEPGNSRLLDLTLLANSHVVTEFIPSITTWSLGQTAVPKLRVDYARWKEKVPESRTWQWDGMAALGFTLPLQGWMLPEFDAQGRLLRRNLFRWQWGSWTWRASAGLGIRIQVMTQGGFNPTRSNPTTVLNSFTPRNTFLAWGDFWLEGMASKGTWDGAWSLRLSKTAVGYSLLNDASSMFWPAGFGAGAELKLSRTDWHPEWFALGALGFNWMYGAGSQALTDTNLALGVGRRF